MKKISLIALTSLLIIPQGLVSSLKGDSCIEWNKGNSNSNIYCVMSSGHNKESQDEASNLWIKSPMECCGKMAGTNLHSEYLTNSKRDPQPSARQFSILKVHVISELSGQTNMLYQESWVAASDPPIKIYKEVNSYII